MASPQVSIFRNTSAIPQKHHSGKLHNMHGFCGVANGVTSIFEEAAELARNNNNEISIFGIAPNQIISFTPGDLFNTISIQT